MPDKKQKPSQKLTALLSGLLILAVLLMSAGCTGLFSGTAQTGQENAVSPGAVKDTVTDTCSFDNLTENTEVYLFKEDSCYFRTHTPMDFLNDLRMHPDVQVTVLEVPDDWITLHDAELLMQEIESDDPAAPVVSPLSSYYPFNQTSTVGNEAMFLLEGYRVGRYPPDLCSLYYFRGNITEMTAWWDTYGKQEST